MKIELTKELGKLIRDTRKNQGLTQSDLAFACGVGVRFILDVENGKETAQIGKILNIIKMLGLTVNIGE